MAAFSLTTASNLFKTKFGKLADNTYNSYNVTLARMTKKYDFVGDQIFVSQPLSFSGGVGSGSLPTAGVADYGKALITAKKVYARMEYDRESIKASSTSEGAFIEGVKEVTRKGVESYMRNASRILYNDGTGSLGEIASGGVSGTNPYTLTITSATWKEANFEENDLVNIETSNTDLFEVTAVDPANLQVTVNRISGSQVPVSGDVIFMQGSEDNDPEGLKGVLDATSSTKYNITVGRRWRATQKAAGGAGITSDLMNEVMLEVERKTGKAPNLIIASYKQYRKILNFLEDDKRYPVEPRAKNLQGRISFDGVQYLSSAGAVPVFPERFVDDDRVYFVNDNYVTAHHRPDFGFFDDDGTVFLRKADDDKYEARYGGYYQNYIIPTMHGVITGLA